VRPSGDAHYARLRPELLARGERNGSARLTADDVVEIRNCYAHRYFTMPELGENFDVTKNQIWHIVHRHSWAHVA
jgi:hypothetical protein